MSLDDSEQCLRCQQPSLAPYIPSNPQVKKPEYTPGDIYGIFETIATAVAYFFEEENPKRGRKRPNTIKRPSLIFHRSAPPNRDKTTQFIVVCLFATFHVTQRFEDLPTVLKHFCVPVSPNVLIKPGIEHMHTDPEWAREDAYLLLLPFPARRHRLDVRWEDGRHGDVVGASFRLNEEEYRKIVALTDATFKKWEEWMKENPERAAEAVAEYWATGERAKETQRNLNSWQATNSKPLSPVKSHPSPTSSSWISTGSAPRNLPDLLNWLRGARAKDGVKGTKGTSGETDPAAAGEAGQIVAKSREPKETVSRLSTEGATPPVRPAIAATESKRRSTGSGAPSYAQVTPSDQHEPVPEAAEPPALAVPARPPSPGAASIRSVANSVKGVVTQVKRSLGRIKSGTISAESLVDPSAPTQS